MGSLGAPPASASDPSASFLLPSLTPAMDNWFISSTSDHLLTQALTRELRSASASSSSSSGPSLEPFAQSNKYSDGLLHLQAQSNLSQVGSPLSSDSVCKEQPESPFNHTSGGSNHQAPRRGYNKPPQAPSSALSSQAAAGAGASKVSKRRSRSNKKPPIAVLSADASNFRAMVQQLTGIPSPQALPYLWGTSGVPLLKPQPTRLSPLDLTTLDTSSSFLAAGAAGVLAPEFPSFQGNGKHILGSSYYPNIVNYDALLSASMGDYPSNLLAANANSDGKGELKHQSAAANLAKEGKHYAVAGLSSTSIENFLMDYEDQNPKVSYNSIDSWLANFDGGALVNHSPRVDFTKIAS